MRFDRVCLWAIAACIGTFFCAPVGAAENSSESAPHSRAILIGCTTYDFKKEWSLNGPSNDVALMTELLANRFDFSRNNIRCLVEGASLADRPTKANIVREIKAIIHQAQPRQKIVIYFAGHGCQQPDQIPADPRDPEPDGLDEILLPADTRPWNPATRTVENAIIDDELRGWSEQLLAKQVDLLVILDACHSGSGMRAVGDEKIRKIKPEDLIPADVLAAAKSSTTTHQHAGNAEGPLDRLSTGSWTALYAAQPHEATLEMRQPRSAANARHYGLFTYSLCQVLQQGQVPNYQELIQRVRGIYLGQGKVVPTPMIEGPDLNRGVLGAPRGDIVFSLELDGDERWFLRAGQLHGVTVGSILSVRSPESARTSKPVGHIVVTEARIDRSYVTPCVFRDQPRQVDLLEGGICQLVFADHGDLKLKVAFDDPGNRLEGIPDSLRTLAARSDSPLTLVDPPELADWLVSCDTEKRWSVSARNTPSEQFGLTSELESMEDTFRRIGRATNLLGLTSRFGNQIDKDGIQVELDCFLYAKESPNTSIRLPADRLFEVKAGDKLKFQVTNKSTRGIDFTLLFLDSKFGIAAVHPRGFAANNSLAAGKDWPTTPATLNAETLGREHVIVIATPAGRVPASFSFLAQKSLVDAEKLLKDRSGLEDLTFAQFLKSAAFMDGRTRGTEWSTMRPIICSRSWVVTAD